MLKLEGKRVKNASVRIQLRLSYNSRYSDFNNYAVSNYII